MRIEDGGGGQEIRFSDIDKYQGNTAQRPFIGFCTCDIVNTALHSLLKNELRDHPKSCVNSINSV